MLAVGGGSVIDCTKAIAAGAEYEGDVWDIINKKVTATKALPFGTVLTLAATGSEMNPDSVITNWETNEKYVWGSSVTHQEDVFQGKLAWGFQKNSWIQLLITLQPTLKSVMC